MRRVPAQDEKGPPDRNAPGKRIPFAFTPAFLRFSTSFRHCVLLPDRSSPSKTIKAPRCELDDVDVEADDALLDGPLLPACMAAEVRAFEDAEIGIAENGGAACNAQPGFV